MHHEECWEDRRAAAVVTALSGIESAEVERERLLSRQVGDTDGASDAAGDVTRLRAGFLRTVDVSRHLSEGSIEPSFDSRE
jgi:hypothetical protein